MCNLPGKINMDYSHKLRGTEDPNTEQTHLVTQRGVLFVSLQVQGKHKSDHNKPHQAGHR